MANCPGCGTWNPDDKTICWRCQTALPKPAEKKQRTTRRFAGLPLYMWMAMVFFVVMMVAVQCFTTEFSRLAG